MDGLKRIGWLYGLMMATSLLLGLLSKGSASTWPEVVASVVSAVTVLCFVYHARAAVIPLLQWPQIDCSQGLRLAGLGLTFIIAMTGYFAVLQELGVPMIRVTLGYVQQGWTVYAMLLLVSFMPGIFEELAFRGVIQSSLEKILTTREAWLIQAALFSILHLSPLMFPSHFVMGLCFGWLRLKTKSLYPGMALHATWNALVLLEELFGR